MLLVAVNALPTGELKPMMPGFFNLSGMPDECKNPDKGYCTKPYDQHIMLRIEKLLTSVSFYLICYLLNFANIFMNSIFMILILLLAF